MKKTITCVILILSLILVHSAPVLAQSGSPPPSPFDRSQNLSERHTMLHDTTLDEKAPPGEFVLLDALILRPMGLAALGVGLAGSILIFPLTALTDSGSIVGKSLIKEPFDYTFRRQLGDIDVQVNR